MQPRSESSVPVNWRTVWSSVQCHLTHLCRMVRSQAPKPDRQNCGSFFCAAHVRNFFVPVKWFQWTMLVPVNGASRNMRLLARTGTLARHYESLVHSCIRASHLASQPTSPPEVGAEVGGVGRWVSKAGSARKQRRSLRSPVETQPLQQSIY